MARTNPGLYLLLDIYNEAKEYRDEYHRVESIERPRKTYDIDCQTDLHPIPCNINKDYTWNVWDLRRKAIQLANLRKSATHSAQTDCSYERFAIRTQTWGTKSAECQTKQDGSSNVPIPQTFVRYGRGVVESINQGPEQINVTCNIEDQLTVECIHPMEKLKNLQKCQKSRKL